MVSNKVKRNVWLVLSITSACTIIDRAIRLADGSVEWWSLASAVCITALCVKFYLSYRSLVRRGMLFGNTNPFRK